MNVIASDLGTAADAQAGPSECHVLIQRHDGGFLVDCSVMRLFCSQTGSYRFRSGRMINVRG